MTHEVRNDDLTRRADLRLLDRPNGMVNDWTVLRAPWNFGYKTMTTEPVHFFKQILYVFVKS